MKLVTSYKGILIVHFFVCLVFFCPQRCSFYLLRCSDDNTLESYDMTTSLKEGWREVGKEVERQARQARRAECGRAENRVWLVFHGWLRSKVKVSSLA